METPQQAEARLFALPVQELISDMAGDPKMIRDMSNPGECDPLLTAEEVAKRLNTSVDWVWDHSSRKLPLLPAIRFGGGPGRAGLLRYRAGKIEEFIAEQERLSATCRPRSWRKIAKLTCSPTETEE